MEAFISIVGALAGKAAEYTVDPTARQLGYLFKPKIKFQNLRTKVQDLKDAEQRVQQYVVPDERNGEELFDDVKRWLIEVNEKISEQAERQLQEDEEKATKRCFAGFCLDFKSRYHLSKKADQEVDAITQLLTKYGKFEIGNRTSYLPAAQAMEIIRPIKDFEAFGSRNAAFREVMNALENDAVSIIGVYGMGGVGKTTLVTEVAAKQANEKRLFNEVVLVSIKQKPNMVNVQEEIAEKLGMTMTEKNVDLRAARLRKRLKKEGRVLVILDDIWESLDLRALGVPSADEHKGCKILMTSRRLDVLEALNSQPNISIETLKEDEAWNLFKKMAGLVEGSDFQSTAFEVAKRCAGLPIAIATIAKALKPKKNLFEWEDALRQLSQPSERNFKGIPKDAYAAIELSYTFLDTEEVGPIFLLCSVMAHDADVEDLLRYAIGLGFIHDVNTMKESRNRVLTLVNSLMASCLLQEGSHPNCFDMHDVVRDVAQSIASRDLHWLTSFKKRIDDEKMKTSQLISLQNTEVSELLNHELDCPNLTCFSIGMEHYSSLNISKNFFIGMQRLKVLEFNNTTFRSLPSSIGCLKTLCTLRLRNCGLEDIAILGELENLEILDLRESSIAVLPKEIGRLTKLKLLDLSDCYYLEVITPNVLSKLSRLEELYLYGSFDKWEVEGIENPRSNGSLVELQHLSRLTTLEVHIPDVEAIPKDNLVFGKMERYKISVGDEMWDSYDDREMETSQMLKLKVNKSIHLANGVKHLLGKTQSLYLDGMEDVVEIQMLYHPNVESFGQLRFMKVMNCNMLENLFSFSIVKRLCQLEELEVSNCENITNLIVEKEEVDEDDILEFNKLRILKLNELNRFSGSWCSAITLQSSTCLFDKKVNFPVLEELEISGMDNLKRLWGDQLVEHSFSELTSIELNDCPKLMNVFPLSMLTRLQRLERLKIFRCESVEEIIYEEGGSRSNSSSGGMPSLSQQFIQPDVISFEFSNLTSLDLIDLPNLKSIHHNKMHTINWPSLKEMTMTECHRVEIVFAKSGETSSEQPLFWMNEMNFSVLEKLDIKDMDNLERLWTDQLVEHSFSKLTSIVLWKFPKLMNVFPLSMLTRLQRLESLEIRRCESVEEIIYEGGSSSSSSSGMPLLSPQFIQSFEFPNLTSFTLDDLPNLKSIYHNKMLTINWPSLKNMTVDGCEKVEIVFAKSGETSSEQPLFWVNESTFPNLQQLSLGCHCNSQQQQQLLSHYFPNLKVIKLWGYPKEVTLLPSYLLSLPNLQTLEMEYCSFKELIFQSEEGGEEQPAALLELRHLWKEKEGFPNLRILHVGHCPELKVNLVPSSVSFRNLVTLEVEGCDGIIKLITHSTAKSLVQLQQMSISRCKNIEEIIQGGDDDDDDDISFPKLNHLELEDLPKLESLCSSDKYTFGFPSLELLIVEDCPKMKMFSQGNSNTPLLHKVQLDKYGFQERWEGSLDITIQKLFREQVI